MKLKQMENRRRNVFRNFVLTSLSISVVCINSFYCLYVLVTVYDALAKGEIFKEDMCVYVLNLFHLATRN